MVPVLRQLSCTGKRVLLRAELNVPLRDGKVVDDWRARLVVPTIKFLLSQGVQQVLITAHLGRPGGKRDEELSLAPLAPLLEELVGEPVLFVPDIPDEPPDERLVLLENLRFYPGEEENSGEFARRLARLGDSYVNDAFGVLHREHASVVALPKLFPGAKAAGLLVERELENLDFSHPEQPFVAVIGAAKIDDKVAMLSSLLKKVEKLLLGGASIFPFFKAMGYEVGESLCDAESVPLAKKLLEEYGEKIVLPRDVVISESLEGTEIFTVDVDKIPRGMKGLDVGDISVEEFQRYLAVAKTIFWNGPLGVFEVEPFDHATNQLAHFLAQRRARVVVGGGDTAAAVNKLGLTNYFSHVSSGGGAALKYVAGEKLPGLEALK